MGAHGRPGKEQMAMRREELALAGGRGARHWFRQCVEASLDDVAVHHLHLDSGDSLRARAVILAAGADYRRLPVEGLERYEGTGVYYAATAVEARLCGGETVVVVGGGNSAGQAAIFLTEYATRVVVCIRGEDLRKA